MNQKVTQFLNHHRIAVLSLVQNDGVVHSATVNFAYSQDPLAFYFCTGKSTDKCRSLLNNEKVSAAVVIGFSEEEYITVQAEGTVEIVQNDEIGWTEYLKKFPHRASGKDNPHVAMLKFIPTWLRYRDYKSDPPDETIVIEKTEQPLDQEWQRLDK